MKSDVKKTNRIGFLVGVLFLIGGVYLLALPSLNRMKERTNLLNTEAVAATLAAERAKLGRTSSADSAKVRADSNPINYPAQMQAAFELNQAGQFEIAEKYASQAMLLKPDDPTAGLALAETQRRGRKYYASLQTYRELIRRHPTSAQAAVSLGSLYVTFGWTLDALATLKSGLTANPNNLELKITLALACLQQDNMGEAVRLLQEVRRAEPEKASQWSPIVDVYIKAHRYVDAIAAAEEILKIAPENINVANELAEACMENGNFTRAISTYQGSLDKDPKNIPARYGLAKSYQRAGKEKESQLQLEAILQSKITYADVQLLLGQIYLRTNRVPEGRELLNQYKATQALAEKAKHAGYNLSNRTNLP